MTDNIKHYAPSIDTGDKSFSVETEDGYIQIDCVKNRNHAVQIVRGLGKRVLSIMPIEE